MVTPTAVTNRDNDWLLPFGPIGHVEAVNGPGARERPEFVPTHDELMHLARHWMTEAKTIHYRWFWWGHVGSDQIRVEPFALRRLSRIAALVGDAAVDQIAREVEAEIEPDPRVRRLYHEGSDRDRHRFQACCLGEADRTVYESVLGKYAREDDGEQGGGTQDPA